MIKFTLLAILLVNSSLSSQLRVAGIAVSNSINNGASNAVATNGAIAQSQTSADLSSNAKNIGNGSAIANAQQNTLGNAVASGPSSAASANAQASNSANALANNANANANLNANTNSTSVALETTPSLGASNANAANSAAANQFLINLDIGLFQTIDVKAGVAFNIMLPGSPNSGYVWMLNQPSLLNLNLIAALNLNLEASTDSIITTSVQAGVSANYSFAFNAVAKGHVTLNFALGTPNSNTAPSRLLTLNVNIA